VSSIVEIKESLRVDCSRYDFCPWALRAGDASERAASSGGHDFRLHSR